MKGPPKAGLWTLAELFALTGLAIAQPVLEVTGRSPDLFLFRRADRLDILALVVGVTVLPALGIWVVEALVAAVAPLPDPGSARLRAARLHPSWVLVLLGTARV